MATYDKAKLKILRLKWKLGTFITSSHEFCTGEGYYSQK